MSDRPTNEQLRRFMRNVVPQPNGCWHYISASRTPDGYGTFIPSPGAPKVAAHRWIFTVYHGTIPSGMQLDHRCHTADLACEGGTECQHRRCVNPDHLEVVTPSENTLRQRHAERGRTHCPNGHPYDGDNLIIRSDGKRRCRTCDRARKRKSPLGMPPY